MLASSGGCHTSGSLLARANTRWASCTIDVVTILEADCRALNVPARCLQPYEQLVRRAADATRAAGERLPADAPDKLFELWQQGGLKPWPETIETLTLLRERHPNAKFGVFTNCSAELGHIAAKACQSDKFQFDAVLTAEEAGFYKPRKETRRAILKLMGLNMHDCKETVFVAGSFLDVEGPLRDGMCVLWNNHAKMQAPPGVKPHREQHTLNGALQEYLREPA